MDTYSSAISHARNIPSVINTQKIMWSILIGNIRVLPLLPEPIQASSTVGSCCSFVMQSEGDHWAHRVGNRSRRFLMNLFGITLTVNIVTTDSDITSSRFSSLSSLPNSRLWCVHLAAALAMHTKLLASDWLVDIRQIPAHPWGESSYDYGLSQLRRAKI